MSSNSEWSRFAKAYDPVKVGSIDGTDTEPHDQGIIRAYNSKYSPNAKVKGDPRHTIFIGRLHTKTDEDKLKEKFKRFGKIVRCRVVRDIITSISKRYGFIEYDSSAACRDAIRNMNRSYIHEYEILVDFECERTLKGWKPRRLGGGFGGKKESGQLRFGGTARPFKKPLELECVGNRHSQSFKETDRIRKYKK